MFKAVFAAVLIAVTHAVRLQPTTAAQVESQVAVESSVGVESQTGLWGGVTQEAAEVAAVTKRYGLP